MTANPKARTESPVKRVVANATNSKAAEAIGSALGGPVNL